MERGEAADADASAWGISVSDEAETEVVADAEVDDEWESILEGMREKKERMSITYST